MIGCTNITDAGVGKIAKASARLQTLDLYGCTGVGEFGDHALKQIGSYCSDLKVSEPAVDNIGVLQSGNGVQQLHVGAHSCSCSHRTRPVSQSHFGSKNKNSRIHSTTLIQLIMRTCAQKCSKHTGDAPLLNILTPCNLSLDPTIKVLNLGVCKRVEDGGLHALALGCVRLEQLLLSGCDTITGKGFRSLLKHGRYRARPSHLWSSYSFCLDSCMSRSVGLSVSLSNMCMDA